MEFPDVPEAYIRHFMRGCWDGDGSIFSCQKIWLQVMYQDLKSLSKHLLRSYIRLESPKAEYPIGLRRMVKGFSLMTKIEENGKRVFLPITKEVLSNLPDRRFPLTIHMKNINAYYIKIQRRESVEKLFHYFYDGVDESIYLSRKYNVFVKGLKLEKKEVTEQSWLSTEG